MYNDFVSLHGNATGLNAIKNSIKNILMTQRGSLPGKPRFGCDLYKIVFRPLDPLTMAIAKNYVMEALTEYEDRINVRRVELRRDDAFNKLLIDIVFTYKDISQAELHGESSVSLAFKL